MEQANKEQNGVIFSIAEILFKMSNQVNFLIRNHKLLSQLDVDMLMENTRRLYDTVCSVQCNMDADSIPMEVENECEVSDEAFRMEDKEDDIVDNEDIEIEEDIEDNECEVSDEELETVEEDDDIEEEVDTKEEIITFDFDDNGENEESSIEIEDLEEKEEDDEKDDDKEDSGIRSYIKEPKAEIYVHTIGEEMELKDDNSLVSVLQKKSIDDLMTAIDLNDRFMLLNELFNSNMEKYNKSIRTLNSFSTLLGAKTYMSELQIEFQWDCESEAYKKLADLIERRFI